MTKLRLPHGKSRFYKYTQKKIFAKYNDIMRMQITRGFQLEDEKCYHIDRIEFNSFDCATLIKDLLLSLKWIFFPKKNPLIKSLFTFIMNERLLGRRLIIFACNSKGLQNISESR